MLIYLVSTPLKQGSNGSAFLTYSPSRQEPSFLHVSAIALQSQSQQHPMSHVFDVKSQLQVPGSHFVSILLVILDVDMF